FQNMSNLSYELAKGNLSMPVKEEKSKLFGRFLWGMDMLREKLEDNKEKELEFQKERKTLILSLSHDIKTPLSSIELYSKALSEDLYDTKERKDEALQGIARNVKEIKGYVDEIVTASREDFLNLEVSIGEYYLS
ncbi:MAG: sensor histidine kinase, partial [Clostridia bacterium]|nr:sensor histidine kinase [Clostridia bacterium]